MTLNNVSVEKLEGGVTVVKVNRPKALNALNFETLKELAEVLRAEAVETSTRVLVFSGEGDKAFIAGADIIEMQKMTAYQGVNFGQMGHEVALLLETMPKPTIAAVNGFALGGGAEMALACDFIYASEKAVFGLPEVSLGVIPGFGGNIRLAKAVGISRAKEIIFSGRKFDAKEALALGVASRVFSHENFLPAVIEVAKSIAVHSNSAIVQSKKLLNEFSETHGMNFKIDAEIHAFSELFGSHDQKEGMTAFVEKRKPTFKIYNKGAVV